MELLTLPEVTATFMVPDFREESELRALVEKLIAFSQVGDTAHLEVGVYLNGRMIGFINDCGIGEDDIELGYVIHPAQQGHGYAAEAVRAVIGELFGMGFTRITAGYFEENAASRRVMIKCGMRPIERTDVEEYRGRRHLCRYCVIERGDV